ncbi:P-loop containing nucleoside triphosphate hydrolase protein [Mycena galopus ATCC 62051]|nr:P-loop containing nucleoside triphosphate hydrolase protein [Mycena galopus ATCC 62051]
MASSFWSRSSSGCIASTSRVLCSSSGAKPSSAANARTSVFQLLRSTTCRRSYAAEAALQIPHADAAPESKDVEVGRAGPSFQTLSGKITKETLDAITIKPFRLQNMSSVQAEVLPMLPNLSEPFRADTDTTQNVRDLLVRAKTGTGKTLAFLVPAIEARVKSIQEHLAGNTDTGNVGHATQRFARRTVGTLVISPTRELATQIANEALRLTHNHKDFEVRLFTGGTSKRMQMRDWMKGRKDIVVSTPGRLRDLLESEPDVRSAIAETSVLILDEADTLLDMGFREDIEDIKRFIPPTPQRQTLLFSATVSKEIRQIARSTLASNHKYINCVSEDSSPVHAHVDQYHTVLPSAAAQIPHILRLIAHDQLVNAGKSKIVLFLATTKMTQLTATLVNALASTTLPAGPNTRVYEIHSKRTMEQRTRVSDAFRNAKGGATVLVTTDVSARGVDYPGVTRVIQVGIPGGREQYIHRVGRTGRAGGAGRGDLVLLPWEIGFVTWQLTDVPLKPLAVNELAEQVTTLATKCDEDKMAFFQQAKAPGNITQALFKNPVTPIAAGIEEKIGALLGRLDEDAVRETFMSLLGYYMSKTPELRIQKSVVVQGCQDWATGACGLAVPPYVSAQFLEKLGLSDGRTKHFGKTTHSMPSFSRTNAASAPWMGRGSTAKRREQGTRPAWQQQENNDTSGDADVSEYKTGRYRDVGTGYSGAPGKGRGYAAEYRGGFGGRPDKKDGFGIGLGYQGGPMGVDMNSGPRGGNFTRGRGGEDSGDTDGFGMGGGGRGGDGGRGRYGNGERSSFGGRGGDRGSGGYGKRDGGYARRDGGSGGGGGYGKRDGGNGGDRSKKFGF